MFLALAFIIPLYLNQTLAIVYFFTPGLFYSFLIFVNASLYVFLMLYIYMIAKTQ